MDKVLIILSLVLLSCVSINYTPGVMDITDETPPQAALDWLEDQQDPGLQGHSFDSLNFPLVADRSVTFVYFNPQALSVSLSSPINGYAPEDYLKSYDNSGLFWKTLDFQEMSSFEYRYRVTLKDGTILKIRDPLNHTITPYSIRISFFQNPEVQRGRLLGLPKLSPPQNSLAKRRALYVYLPKAYYDEPDQRFPVFYFMDGQNLWSHEELPYGGWQLDSTLDKLINQGEVPPMILVGVPNSSQRNPEYMGSTTYYGAENPKDPELQENNSLRSSAFQSYLVETVKPFIDTNFRTIPDRDNTFIGGSSFGAGISVQLFINYPGVFGKLAAFSLGQYHPVLSPTRWRQKPFNLVGWVKDHPPRLIPESRIYMDCGTVSVDEIFYPHGKQIHDYFLAQGYSDENCRWLLDPGGEHNEAAWARRMPEALKFLFE
jgi:enterochelin esterase-like enzyme